MRLIAILLLVLARPAARPPRSRFYVNPLGDPGHEWHLGDYLAPRRVGAVPGRLLPLPRQPDRARGRGADLGPHRGRRRGSLRRGGCALRTRMYSTARLVVLLDSGGGSLLEAIGLGRAIGERGLATVVPPGFGCVSACVFVLAGGSSPRRDRQHGRLRRGAHRPSPAAVHLLGAGAAGAGRRAGRASPTSLPARSGPRSTYFMINVRRNVLLLQLMLASPKEADRFNDLDSFEELFLAGVQLVALAVPGGGHAAGGAPGRDRRRRDTSARST